MPSRGTLLGLLVLLLSGCNFRIDPGWTPPGERDNAPDAVRGDAGLEGGALAAWCRDECAAEDQEQCTQVLCADAAVCADAPSCDTCLACRDH